MALTLYVSGTSKTSKIATAIARKLFLTKELFTQNSATSLWTKNEENLAVFAVLHQCAMKTRQFSAEKVLFFSWFYATKRLLKTSVQNLPSKFTKSISKFFIWLLIDSSMSYESLHARSPCWWWSNQSASCNEDGYVLPP